MLLKHITTNQQLANSPMSLSISSTVNNNLFTALIISHYSNQINYIIPRKHSNAQEDHKNPVFLRSRFVEKLSFFPTRIRHGLKYPWDRLNPQNLQKTLSRSKKHSHKPYWGLAVYQRREMTSECVWLVFVILKKQLLTCLIGSSQQTLLYSANIANGGKPASANKLSALLVHYERLWESCMCSVESK